ncbi:MAG: CoA-binding protein [Haloarculaceae archaeon]
MPATTDDELAAALDAETTAVVGCSRTPGKAAHDIPRYLLEHGYEVLPVNPNAEEIFGRTAYDSLSEVEEQIDLVDVFRPSHEVSEVVDEALERDDVETVWLQLGIRDGESGERVETAGKRFVQDRCIKVEHRRLASA